MNHKVLMIELLILTIRKTIINIKCFSILISIFLFYGCSFGIDQTLNETSYNKLINHVEKHFMSDRQKIAIEILEDFNKKHPFGHHSPFVKLKIADAYFQINEFTIAIIKYKSFEQFYPHNIAIPYVFYKTGLSYFNLISDSSRDQTYTHITVKIYNKLINQFPNNEYSSMAKIDTKNCYKNLSGHEFGIGVFYYSKKNYKAALSRFIKVIIDYQDTGYHRKALFYLEKCEYWIKIHSKATKIKNYKNIQN